jgi:hypothetical protein
VYWYKDIEDYTPPKTSVFELSGSEYDYVKISVNMPKIEGTNRVLPYLPEIKGSPYDCKYTYEKMQLLLLKLAAINFDKAEVFEYFLGCLDWLTKQRQDRLFVISVCGDGEVGIQAYVPKPVQKLQILMNFFNSKQLPM